MIDWQPMLLWILGAACAVGGWFLRVLWDAVDKLKAELSALSAECSNRYVRRDDYREDMKELKEMVGQIWQALREDQRGHK